MSPAAGVGPQPLALALLVVRHHRAGGFQDVLGGAVILLQADDLGVRDNPARNPECCGCRRRASYRSTDPRRPPRRRSRAPAVSSRISSYWRAVGVLILVDHQVTRGGGSRPRAWPRRGAAGARFRAAGRRNRARWRCAGAFSYSSNTRGDAASSSGRWIRYRDPAGTSCEFLAWLMTDSAARYCMNSSRPGPGACRRP